jgi:transposase-like protein
MKKSYTWDMVELLTAYCPRCGHAVTRYGQYDEGRQVRCYYCNEEFELGEQR